MFCNGCRRSFARLDRASNNDRASILDAARPNCACQYVNTSRHSPGAVTDGEILVRLVVSPVHVDKKKRIPKAGALTQAETGGLSVFRDAIATNEEILTAAQQLVANARKRDPSAGIFGVLMMPCHLVRESKAEGETDPAYCVYDTALATSAGHSEAFQRVAGVDPSIRDARRNSLYSAVLSKFVPVSEFRNGLLSGLAPP